MATDDTELVGIGRQENLPPYCCTCGMFSDGTVRVKYQTSETQVVEGSDGMGPALGCLLLFLGPIGLILSLALKNKSGSKLETRTKKRTFEIPQCRLCTADSKPIPLATSSSHEVSIQVHPDFARRLREQRAREKDFP